MILSQTAVLEKNTKLSGEFATEPFEAAWSREARWFFQIVDGDGSDIEVCTQISPDGLTWIDLEDAPRRLGADELTSWSVRDYGAWLRIRGTIPEGRSITARIYLALKE